MILSGDLKIYRARNTKHFSYLTSPRRSDTTRHAQLRVGRSLVTLLIGVSFSFNAFCFLSCTVIQTENMGHVIKSFTAKIFFVSDNEILLEGKSFGLPWVIFLFKLFDLRKPFVGRLSMEVTSRVISYKQTCDNRLQRTRPSLKCLMQIEPHANPAKSAKLRNSGDG